MVALGVMGESNELGIEASAVVRTVGAGVARFKPGDRVLICGKGLFRSRTVVDQTQCIGIPPKLLSEEAATIPAVYATAFYSLVTIGQLEAGKVSK